MIQVLHQNATPVTLSLRGEFLFLENKQLEDRMLFRCNTNHKILFNIGVVLWGRYPTHTTKKC